MRAHDRCVSECRRPYRRGGRAQGRGAIVISDSAETTGTVASEPAIAARRRPLGPRLAAIERGLLAALTLLGAGWALELHFLAGLSIFTEQFLGLIFALGMTAVFLRFPARKADVRARVPWYDWLAIAASLAVGLNILVNYRMILDTFGAVTPDRYLPGIAAIALVIEATRRVTGWPLVALCVTVICYALTSHLFPGILNAPSPSVTRAATYLYLDNNALLGLPLDVTASIIIAFILFGRTLYAVNGDRLLTDLSLATMGRYRGGPAKVAVLASSFFGTISGSAVSNVVMDGPITIPMMRKSGYPAHIAAAIEAVASTGGQIMPPVMGITAFLIAEYLQISYGEVVLAALIPALLYYVALYMQVDLEAARFRLAGLPRETLPRLADVLPRIWLFVVPITVLIWTLIVENWRPGRSAMAAVFLTLAVAMLYPDTRPTLRRLWAAVIETGETILDLVVITAVAGVIIGAFQLSGLSFNFSLLLVTFSGGSVLVLLILTAVVCIILGMGMPTGVIYMMLAVLVSPALTEMGVLAISAHLFLFYFGMLSMITPPVCLATFAAATIAETPFWQAGWAGVRLGIAAYVVPFVVVFQPGLVFEGGAFAIVTTTVKSVVGVAVLAVGVVGYVARPVGWLVRGGLIASALALLWVPLDAPAAMLILPAALALAGALLFAARRPDPQPDATPPH